MFQTNPVSLNALLNDAGSGRIQLPDFQRGWVWDDDRIKGLLSSISRGFPVGAIMTLAAGGEMRLKSRLIEGADGNAADGPDAYLLDGQQRLTSLYQSLLHDGPVNTHDNRGRRIKRWYYVDMLAAMDPSVDREDAFISVPEDKKETRNFGRDVVRDLSSQEKEFQQNMMPTERLLDPMNWILGYNYYWLNAAEDHPAGDAAKFLNDFNGSIVSAFGGYNLPVITLDKETPKEAVCTVFEKVNTGGVTLSMFELVTATFAGQDDDFSLRDDWNARRQRLHGRFGVLQGIWGNQFLQAIALLTTQERRRKAIASGRPQNQLPAINCRKNDILGMDVSDYRRWADKVERGFMDAGRFLRSQFVFRSKDVPYTTQLVPLAVLYVELGSALEPSTAREKLERWYWSGIFGESYGGAVETQYGLDLAQVAEWIRGGPEPTLVSEANFIPERLLSLRTRSSAAYKGLYALQMKSDAADWRTADPLTAATWDDSRVDIHHIFPVAWCGRQNPPVPRRLYDSIINKTPVDARTNKIIGGNAPSRYLRRLQQSDIKPDKLQQVLRSHWINPDLLADDQFAQCFVERGEAMLELIEQAMGKQLSSGHGVFWSALERAGFVNKSTEPVASPAGFVDDFDEPDDEHDEIGQAVDGDDDAAIAAD